MDESEAAAYTADYDDNGSPSKSNENDDDDDDDYEKNDEVFQDEADAGSLEMQPLQKEGSLKQQQHQPQQGSDGLFHDRHGHPQQPGGLWSGLNDFLYPPNLPRSCQLLRKENIAVPLCYLLVGLLQGLSSPLINVFPIDLGATEAQQTTLSSIKSLPASFKLIFGFLSDNFSFFGYRRKPYMFAGWLLSSAAMMMLILFTNLDISSSDSGCFNGSGSGKGEDPPDDAPSIPLLALCFLLFGTGYWLADVMGDSIVAEKAKLEPAEHRGSIQSSCYSYRFFGLMAAAPLSTYMYTAFGPYSVILFMSLLPLVILPAICMLGEVPNVEIKSTPEQCREIWNTVSSRACWQPMGFVFLYNILQVSNGAWREFQKTVLGFTSCQLNLILIVAYVLLYLGILSYKYYFIKYSWRHVYISTSLLSGVFSVLQVLLIYGITFGLSPFLFALGDDVFTEFIGGIQFLPTTIMMVHLCPAGKLCGCT